MKKTKFFLTMFVFAALFAACTNEMDEWQMPDNGKNAGETRASRTPVSLAADLDGYTLNATNGRPTTGGYYWNQTYSNTLFATTNFTFSHTSMPEWNYWDGFTVSNVANTTNYGAPGSSGGWLPHQWGCMAVPTGMVNKPNFLVGYWGYYMLDYQNEITPTTTFAENKYALWAKLGNNAQTYTVNHVKVAIHPWPYYGNLNGDGFARPFRPGDHFDLIVYGVKANGNFVTTENDEGETIAKSITYKMADYPIGGSLIMPTGWTNIAINFGEPIKYLVFQMFSTDNSEQLGPNTAVYFCLRDIVMQ